MNRLPYMAEERARSGAFMAVVAVCMWIAVLGLVYLMNNPR